MTISVNNAPFELEIGTMSMGGIIGALDEIIDNAGQLIVGIEVNGATVGAGDISALESHNPRDTDTLSIYTESISTMKIRAIETLLELVAATMNGDSDLIQESVRDTWAQFKAVFGGLFSAEEGSFLETFEAALGSSAPKAGATIAEMGKRMNAFFSERLVELKDPRLAMKSAENVFNALKADLCEVPVRMQTGKDMEAMRTMVLVVELINKTVRILPEFSRHMQEPSVPMMIGEKSVQDFYDDFNAVLRELMSAFEHKDSVLIGDLAEYEILPRMTVFFGTTSKMMASA